MARGGVGAGAQLQGITWMQAQVVMTESMSHTAGHKPKSRLIERGGIGAGAQLLIHRQDRITCLDCLFVCNTVTRAAGVMPHVAR